jgi:hypothetical protein
VLAILQNDFLPRIRFVDLPAGHTPADLRAVKVAAMDPTDLPTAQLALMLAPCHVYSLDKHLRIPGLAPRTRPDLDSVIAASFKLSSADVVVASGGFALNLSAAGVAGGVKSLAVRLDGPVWTVAVLGVLAVGVLTGWALSSHDRRIRVAQIFGGLAAPSPAWAQERASGLAVLQATQVQSAAPSLADRIARVLARADGPQLAAEILDHLVAADAASAPSLRAVREQLEANPAFVKAPRYRWQFGRRLALPIS